MSASIGQYTTFSISNVAVKWEEHDKEGPPCDGKQKAFVAVKMCYC